MIKGSDFFNSWFDDLKCGMIIEPWDCGLSTIEIEARKVIGISGQPGVGKSAFVSQICFDALENNPDIKVLFCNVEMPMQDIFNREMARQAKVPLWMIRRRKFRENEEMTRKIETASGKMKSYLERVYFVESPFTFLRLEDAVEQSAAEIIVIDYIQRIILEGGKGSKQEQIVDLMSKMRHFAMSDRAVIVLSAAARNRQGKGGAYSKMDIGSFRDSSEIEYGCDDLYLMEYTTEIPVPCAVNFSNVKKRNGEKIDFICEFCGDYQEFVPKWKTGQSVSFPVGVQK